MGLFYLDNDNDYAIKGTQAWNYEGNGRRQALIKGTFQQRGHTGIVKTIDFNCDNQSIYFYCNNGVKSLELSLTVIQEHFYYIGKQKVYEIKLKRKNLITIIWTKNFESFLTFYKHLGKFCILISFEKHFKVLDEIGKGTFSKVYNGLNIISKQYVALKVFDKKQMSSIEYGIAIITNQITNLQKLRKYRLSPLIGVYETNDCIIMALQKAEAGNMLNYLKHHAQDYNEELIKNIIFKILQNLRELHCVGFIHRDIKPQNIFFENYSFKSGLFLGDFGCSVMKKDSMCSKVGKINSGTLGFVAPQIIKTNSYNEMCDLFSLGSLFYFLLTGEPIFCKKRANEIYEIVNDDTIIEKQINQVPNVSEKCKNLLKSMVKVNPEQRISAERALKHNYFQNMKYQLNATGEQNRTLVTYLQSRVQKFFNSS